MKNRGLKGSKQKQYYLCRLESVMDVYFFKSISWSNLFSLQKLLDKAIVMDREIPAKTFFDCWSLSEIMTEVYQKSIYFYSII